MLQHKTEFSVLLRSLRIHPSNFAQIACTSEQTIYNYIVNRTRPKGSTIALLWTYSQLIDMSVQKLVINSQVKGFIPFHENFAEAYPELVPLNDDVQLLIVDRTMIKLNQLQVRII